MEIYSLSEETVQVSEPTQDALLRWRRHNESIWSMFFRKLLVEAEEVAEASPHCKYLVAEHGQCGLKHSSHNCLHQQAYVW